MLPSERAWVAAIDIAAWGVLVKLDEEAEENAERKAKGLPPLPNRRQLKKTPSDTIEIKVNGEKRRVPVPPPGCFYGPDGQLIKPQGAVQRF